MQASTVKMMNNDVTFKNYCAEVKKTIDSGAIQEMKEQEMAE